MSPPIVSSTSTPTTASYTQCPNIQPTATKSPGKQVSACPPCRTRRLRCDLQDLPSSSSNSICSNCIQRGFDYVGGCAEIQTVKRYRRGRRARQVEAIYGKIPALKREFFASKFWTWFCIQHPVLDPSEFSQRYIAHLEGRDAMDPDGVVLAMLLAVWAASFGLDESGSSGRHDFINNIHQVTEKNLMLTIDFNSPEAISASPIDDERRPEGETRCKPNISVMLMQILELIGMCGILRRPTLDGIRVLFLIGPLIEGSPYLEKAVIHEAAFSHTRILRAVSATVEDSDNFTRIFLYAHIYGITTTLKCGHPVFRNEDFDTLQRMIRLLTDKQTTCTASLGKGGNQMMQLILVPLRLSSVCSKILSVITGLRAARRPEECNLSDSSGMHEIWQDLEQCWQELLGIKSDAIADAEKDNIEYFVDAWLIFVFECYNWILESLRHLVFGANPYEPSPLVLASCLPASQASTYSSSLLFSPLYQEARLHCVQRLPHILRIIRYHLRKSASGAIPNLFVWDAGLIRDGCFYAGLLAADLYRDIQCLGGHESENQWDESEDCTTPEEGVNLILSALREMHWVFSKSEERSEILRLALQRSKETLQRTDTSVMHKCPMAVSSVLGTPDLGGALPISQKRESNSDAQCATRSKRWAEYMPLSSASCARGLSSQDSIGFLSPYGGSQKSQDKHQGTDSRNAPVAVDMGPYCFVSDSLRPDALFPTINDPEDYAAAFLPNTHV